MNLTPVLGLFGAVLASLSIFKWILVGLLIVVVLWMFSQNKNRRNALDTRALKDLVKSSAQWNARAQQDTNPLIGLMNSNYAMAYLNVARSLGSDTDIEKHTSAAVDELLKEVEGTQSRAMQKLTMACPAMTPQGLAAVHTGWLSK
jgi:hypothetical protein